MMYMGVTKKKKVYTQCTFSREIAMRCFDDPVFLEVFYFRTPYFQDLEPSIRSNLEPIGRGWILESPVGIYKVLDPIGPITINGRPDDKVSI